MKKFITIMSALLLCACETAPPPPLVKTPGLDGLVNQACSTIQEPNIEIVCNYSIYYGRFDAKHTLACNIGKLENPKNSTIYKGDGLFVRNQVDFSFTKNNGTFSTSGNWQAYNWKPEEIITKTKETCAMVSDYLAPWNSIEKKQ